MSHPSDPLGPQSAPTAASTSPSFVDVLRVGFIVYCLDSWAVVMGPATPYTPPEMLTQHLNGTVSGHPSFADGSIITTSSIIGKCKINDKECVVTSSRSIYELGEPEPQYEQLHPNSKARLMGSLPFVSV